jgi:predicted nucleic acid-binding protein
VIVVDTNVLVYLLVPGEHTEQAERVFLRDPLWAAPLLWRSEFRNVLAVYMRRRLLSLDQALQLTGNAEILMQGREYEISSALVLSLVAGTRCSAYDGEFVALAQDLGLPLVTSDARLLAEFPTTTIAMDSFGV